MNKEDILYEMLETINFAKEDGWNLRKLEIAILSKDINNIKEEYNKFYDETGRIYPVFINISGYLHCIGTGIRELENILNKEDIK